MPRTVLFGYEGVLVDLEAARFRALKAVLFGEGIAMPNLEEDPFRPPYDAWLGTVLGRTHGEFEPALPTRLMARAEAAYRLELRDRGPQWVPGAVDAVRKVASRGQDLGVVAGVPRSELSEALERAGLRDSVRVLVTAEDVESTVAGSSGHLVAMVRLNTQPPLPERLIHPHEVVAVEGTVASLKAAQSAGLRSVAVGLGSDERQTADLSIAGLEELDLSFLGSG